MTLWHGLHFSGWEGDTGSRGWNPAVPPHFHHPAVPWTLCLLKSPQSTALSPPCLRQRRVLFKSFMA